MPEQTTAADLALVRLGRLLKDRGYRFTTITPANHRRINARPQRLVPTLQDIFGWSRRFRRDHIRATELANLEEAGELDSGGPWLRSRVRFSTLGDQIFVHSAFPTDRADAVFFGPDTYRFARLLRQSLSNWPTRVPVRVLDIGAGSGAGGLYAATLLGGRATVVLTDVNARALRFCRINALINGIAGARTVESDLFSTVTGRFDLIISNPPYLVDAAHRLYRHGGGELGSNLSVKIVGQGIERLAAGGRLILYTGSAIVDGVDKLRANLTQCLAGRAVRFAYEEIDPDVFGEELDNFPYDKADRIAVVSVVLDAPRGGRNESWTGCVDALGE